MSKATKSPIGTAMLASLCVLWISSPVFARPLIPANSCANLKALIESKGSLVLDLKPGVYRRFVAHSGFCKHGGREHWKIVQARDGKCYLRICRQVAAPLGR